MEKGGKNSAGALVLEFTDGIPARHRGVAHGVETLGELDALIEARIGGGEELDLADAPAGDAPVRFQAKLHALAVRPPEPPSLPPFVRLPTPPPRGPPQPIARPRPFHP